MLQFLDISEIIKRTAGSALSGIYLFFSPHVEKSFCLVSSQAKFFQASPSSGGCFWRTPKPELRTDLHQIHQLLQAHQTIKEPSLVTADSTVEQGFLSTLVRALLQAEEGVVFTASPSKVVFFEN